MDLGILELFENLGLPPEQEAANRDEEGVTHTEGAEQKSDR